MASTLILTCVGCGLLSVAGVARFGSLSSAIADLRGARLIPDAYTKSFGTAGKDDRRSVRFRLTNYSERPIVLVGSDASCTCLVTSDLPAVIPPGRSIEFRVRARFKSRLGPYTERLRVLTDSGESNLVLGVRGVFR